MNILEIAKEYHFTGDQLQEFATAVIEEYKARLVPVAWVYGATLATKYQYNHIYLGDVAIPQPEWEPLCSLPKEKP